MQNLGSIRLSTFALILFNALFSPSAPAQTLKEVAKFDRPGPGGKRLMGIDKRSGDVAFIGAAMTGFERIPRGLRYAVRSVLRRTA